MDIKSLTELKKRALAEISVVIYGDELTRIMIPELREYLDNTGKRDEATDRCDD